MNKKIIGIITCALLSTLVIPTSSSILVPSEWSEPQIITILENQPPTPPELIDGPIYGEPRILHRFTFISEDPDGDNIYYFVDWSDGDFVFWDGPFASGEEATFGHAWQKGGDYTIRVKAKDENEAKSQVSLFDMKVLIRNRTITIPVLTRILERFPNAFPLLRALIL